jgi:glycosyltransferase involved in cell wall biosynthesis
LKILFPFVGDSVGGSHLSTIELYKVLKENGYDVLIVLHDKNGPLLNTLKDNGIECVELKTSFLAGKSPNIAMIFFSMIWNAFPLVFFIKKNNIDIVHGNDLRVNLTWSVAARLAKAKFIWHQRTILSESHFWKCIVFLSSHFIGTSQAVVSSAPKNICSVDKSLVYNAFDTDIRFNKCNSRDLINRKFPECRNALVLGYVGRLVSYKNVDFLIRCLPGIVNSCKKPLHLLVVGSGSKEHMAYLRSIVSELNLQANVTFTGFVCNPSEIISGLDILIASSSIDAFGRTIIESMLQSTPVLVANKGGHLEIVEDEYDGLLYEAKCKNSFIKQAVRLIEDESFRKKLASRALDKSTAKYTKNKLFLAVESIYKSATKVRKGI